MLLLISIYAHCLYISVYNKYPLFSPDIVLKIPKILPRLVNLACAKPCKYFYLLFIDWFYCIWDLFKINLKYIFGGLTYEERKPLISMLKIQILMINESLSNLTFALISFLFCFILNTVSLRIKSCYTKPIVCSRFSFISSPKKN